ncbi:phage minor head protein [Phytoactinopolyspora mesophila]|nr:phage minor head protein [Phytoactinopolyspora mesophila]
MAARDDLSLIERRLLNAEDRANERTEDWITEQVENLFDEARELITKRVNGAIFDVSAAASVDLTFLLSLETEFAELFDRIIPALVVPYALGAESTARYLTGADWESYLTGLGQLYDSSRVQEHLRTAHNRLRDAAAELWGEIRETLVTGVEQGLGSEDLARSIQDTFSDEHGDLSRSRARRIARTETISATNDAKLQTELDLPEELRPSYKRWIAAVDERTRPEHFAADGQTVEIDAPFDVGGEALMFPGDPNASAENVIQCRCTHVVLDSVDGNAPPPPPDSGRQYLSDERIDEVIRYFEEQGVTRNAFVASSGGANMSTKEKFTVRAFERDRKRHQILHFGRPLADLKELTADAMSETEVTIGSARIRAATLVSIPALIEAKIELTGQPDKDGFVGWSGVLAVEGDPTGDGREIALGALRWENLPLDLRWTKFDRGGHDDAVVVGRIDEIERVDGQILATGVIDTTFAEGAAVAALIERGLAGGVSVDLDDIPADQVVWHDDEYGAPEAHEPASVAATDAVAQAASADDEFALVGDINLPINDDRERAWNGSEAASRVLAFATDDDGQVDASVLRQAFLWRDDDANPETVGAYRLGYADVVGDRLEIIARGVFAVAGVLEGAMGGVDLPEADQERIRTRVTSLYEKLAEHFDDDSIVAPWVRDEAAAGITDLEDADELVASAWTEFKKSPPLPAAWFKEPTAEQLAASNGLVACDDGRIYGWIAQSGVPHEGYTRRITIEDFGNVDLTGFLMTPKELDDGSTVKVGTFTMNVGHHRDGAECETSACQFDDSRTVAGVVTVGVNDDGMWFSGAAAPWLSEWDRQVFESCRPSLHLKEQNGRWKLKGLLSVPKPGFLPEVAASAVIDRSNHALMPEMELAASAIQTPPADNVIDYRRLASMVVDEMESRKRIEVENLARVEELKARMKNFEPGELRQVEKNGVAA